MNKLTKAFNNAATDYDVSFTHSAVGLLQRKRVWSYLGNLLKGRKADVLEINCGTGEDALWLADKCYSVTATDAAGDMITVAEGKKIIANKQNIEFKTLNFFQLQKALSPKQFDFIFSDFGGLNCVSHLELEILSPQFAKLLYPGGKMVIVVMGKYCLWETIYFMLKLKFLKSIRRWDNEGVETKMADEEFETWFFTVKELKKIFEKDFRLVDVKPIAFSVPPSYMDNYFNKRKRFLAQLNLLDNLFSKWRFLSNFSDHLILSFEVKDKTKND